MKQKSSLHKLDAIMLLSATVAIIGGFFGNETFVFPVLFVNKGFLVFIGTLIFGFRGYYIIHTKKQTYSIDYARYFIKILHMLSLKEVEEAIFGIENNTGLLISKNGGNIIIEHDFFPEEINMYFRSIEQYLIDDNMLIKQIYLPSDVSEIRIIEDSYEGLPSLHFFFKYNENTPF